jgi:hypothetical protein
MHFRQLCSRTFASAVAVKPLGIYLSSADKRVQVGGVSSFGIQNDGGEALTGLIDYSIELVNRQTAG